MEEIRITSGDDDNIYIYTDPEEELSEVIQTGTNPANPVFERMEGADDGAGEEEADDKEKDGSETNTVSPFLLMLKVLLNPVEGWKAVRRENITSDQAQRGCFYPLLAILAVSKFAELFYNTRIGFQDVFVGAVGIFVSFFFGFFCIILLLRMLMPKEVTESMTTEFGKVFVLLSLSSLCLFFTALELCPMLWAVFIFLPLWTVYAVCRGTRFFRFPDNRQIFCTGLLSMLIIGVPVAIDWALRVILPK